MPQINPIANSLTPQPAALGEHGTHGSIPTVNNATGVASFAVQLSQASGQYSAPQTSNKEGPLIAAGPHGGHGTGEPLPLSTTTLALQRHGAKPHGVQETALGLRAYRQQLIASNIANADTPNYKAVDIDLGDALRQAQSATPPMVMATTSAGHLAAQTSPPPFYSLKYHNPYQASVDGNTVEMDVERSKFAENALMYQFSMDRVSGHFKMMVEMFQNLK